MSLDASLNVKREPVAGRPKLSLPLQATGGGRDHGCASPQTRKPAVSLQAGFLSPSVDSISYTPLIPGSAHSENSPIESPFTSAYASQYFSVDSVHFSHLLDDWEQRRGASQHPSHATHPSSSSAAQRLVQWQHQLERQKRPALAWWQLLERSSCGQATSSLSQEPRSDYHLQALITVSDEILRLRQLQPHVVSLSDACRDRVVSALSTCYQQKSASSLLDQPHIANQLGQYEGMYTVTPLFLLHRLCFNLRVICFVTVICECQCCCCPLLPHTLF